MLPAAPRQCGQASVLQHLWATASRTTDDSSGNPHLNFFQAKSLNMSQTTPSSTTDWQKTGAYQTSFNDQRSTKFPSQLQKWMEIKWRDGMARTWKHVLRHEHFRACEILVRGRFIFERPFQPLSVGGFFSNQRESTSQCLKSPFPSKTQNRQIAQTSPLTCHRNFIISVGIYAESVCSEKNSGSKLCRQVETMRQQLAEVPQLRQLIQDQNAKLERANENVIALSRALQEIRDNQPQQQVTFLTWSVWNLTKWITLELLPIKMKEGTFLHVAEFLPKNDPWRPGDSCLDPFKLHMKVWPANSVDLDNPTYLWKLQNRGNGKF